MSAPSMSTPQRSHHCRWEQWQGSDVSKRLLSREARQAGYAVVEVKPACRSFFLDIADVLLTYGKLFHRHHRFSRETVEAMAAWYQAMQAVKAALSKERYGQS